MFSEEVYLDLLCSSVREPEPELEPFFQKAGAGAVFQRSPTVLQLWFEQIKNPCVFTFWIFDYLCA